MAVTTWKLAEGKTWKQKLEQDHPNHGKKVPIPPRMRKRFGSGKMLIPKPRDVDAIMRKVKKGTLVTQSRIREALARAARVDQTCPLTTGMFIRFAAEAAEESLRAGKRRVTPYWRTIKDNGQLNDKFPGGARAQAKRLREEGFTIQAARGKQPPKIKEFERYLADV